MEPDVVAVTEARATARHRPAGTDSSALQSAAMALLTRLPELAELAFNRIEQEPSYRQAVSREELRQAAHDALGLMLTRLAGIEAAPQFDGCDEIHGERRARQGIPFEAIVRSIHQDFDILWKAIREESLATGILDEEGLLEGVTRLWEVVDLHSSRMALGYHRAEAELDRADEQRRNDLFDALLNGRGSEPVVVHQAAGALRLPDHGPFALVIVESQRETDSWSSSSDEVSALALRRAGMPSAWRHRTERSLGLIALGPRGLPALLEVLGSQCGGRAAVSPPFGSLAETARALALAEATLRSIPSGARCVATLDERLLEALVASNAEIAERFAERVLGPILDRRASERERLLETLGSFFENNGSVSATADRLYCHRNTVLKRLGRIEELTALSPREIPSAVRLYVALEAYRVSSAGPPPRDVWPATSSQRTAG